MKILQFAVSFCRHVLAKHFEKEEFRVVAMIRIKVEFTPLNSKFLYILLIIYSIIYIQHFKFRL